MLTTRAQILGSVQPSIELRSFQQDSTIQDEITAEQEPTTEDSSSTEPALTSETDGVLQNTVEETASAASVATDAADTPAQDGSPRYTIDGPPSRHGTPFVASIKHTSST